MKRLNKTRIYKRQGVWWVDYVLPYSGNLVVDLPTWQDAMAEACSMTMKSSCETNC